MGLSSAFFFLCLAVVLIRDTIVRISSPIKRSTNAGLMRSRITLRIQYDIITGRDEKQNH